MHLKLLKIGLKLKEESFYAINIQKWELNTNNISTVDRNKQHYICILVYDMLVI